MKSVGLTQGALLGSVKAVGRTTKEGKPMTQQSKEDCAVPEGSRKGVPTRGAERPGGGKAVPVNEQAWQPGLPFATAENPEANAEGAVGGADTDQSVPIPRAVPKAKVKERKATSATVGRSIAQSSPPSSWSCDGDRRGRDPAGDGVYNPSSRRAGCEQHLSGSVRAGGG